MRPFSLVMIAVLACPAMAQTPVTPLPARTPVTGPSFGCDLIRDPVGITICGDAGLSRLDMEMSRAYYALRHQMPDEQRQVLKAHAADFHASVVLRCRLPASGPPDLATQRRATPCIAEMYRAARDRYVQPLSPEARAEVQRDLAQHVALQTALASNGFLDATGPADGVYGSGTRDAIARFQRAAGLPVTGFMSATTALGLVRWSSDAVPSAASPPAPAVPPSPVLPATGPVETPPAPRAAPPAPRRRSTPAMQGLAGEGQAGDLLVLANIAPDAPNASLDLSGALVFPSGRAGFCFGPDTGEAFEERGAVTRWLQNRKVAAAATPSACPDVRFAELDGVLVTRQTIGRLPTELFNDVASRLQDKTARAFVILSEAQRQDDRDRLEIGRAGSEQAVAARRPGHGYAALSNPSGTACVVAAEETAQVWQTILDERRRDIEADLGRVFAAKVALMDADAAYVAGRRGACGIIVATADRLGSVFDAFERDGTKGGHGALWLSPETVQDAMAGLQANRDRAAQAAERARQVAAQERELHIVRAQADGAERAAKTKQLRATFGANAAAMRDEVAPQVLTLFGGTPTRDARKDWVPVTFGGLAAEAGRRTREGWTLAEGGSDVTEYGRSNWSGRSLETGVIRVRLKLKNADIGRYDDLCFDLAYQSDTEFQRVRSAQTFACDAPDQLKRWLSGLSYTSNWSAP